MMTKRYSVEDLDVGDPVAYRRRFRHVGVATANVQRLNFVQAGGLVSWRTPEPAATR